MPFQTNASHMATRIWLGQVKRARSLPPSASRFILPDWLSVTFAEAAALTFDSGARRRTHSADQRGAHSRVHPRDRSGAGVSVCWHFASSPC